MKKHYSLNGLIISLIFLVGYSSFSQAVAINTDGSSADASAMLDVNSNSKGILIPRVSSTGSIPTPAHGLLVYQTSFSAGFYYNAGSPATPTWLALLVAGTSAGGDLTGTYPNPSVGFNAITSSKIADGTIINSDINASAAIAYSKLDLTNSITGSDIAEGTFTTKNVQFALSNTTNAAAEIRFLEPSSSGTHYSAFKAQAQPATLNYTLPAIAPTTDQLLKVQSVVGNNATLEWGTAAGASGFNRITKVSSAGNSSYTAAVGDELIGVTMTSGVPFTITLPTGAVSGKPIIIKLERQNTTTFPNLTIQASGSGQIDGGGSVSFANPSGMRRLYSDGAGNWYTW